MDEMKQRLIECQNTFSKETADFSKILRADVYQLILPIIYIVFSIFGNGFV